MFTSVVARVKVLQTRKVRKPSTSVRSENMSFVQASDYLTLVAAGVSLSSPLGYIEVPTAGGQQSGAAWTQQIR